MLVSRASIVQLSLKGRVIKSIENKSSNVVKLKAKHSETHCFQLKDGSIQSADLNAKKISIFSKSESLKIDDYDCYGDLAFIVNTKNIVIKANYETKNVSIIKSRRNKL